MILTHMNLINIKTRYIELSDITSPNQFIICFSCEGIIILHELMFVLLVTLQNGRFQVLPHLLEVIRILMLLHSLRPFRLLHHLQDHEVLIGFRNVLFGQLGHLTQRMRLRILYRCFGC